MLGNWHKDLRIGKFLESLGQESVGKFTESRGAVHAFSENGPRVDGLVLCFGRGCFGT